MKKVVGTLVVALSLLSGICAQSIPEGRELPALVMDCYNDKNAWAESSLVKADAMNDVYIISGYAVNKNLVGYIKQSYDVTITRDNNELVVVVDNMSSVACKKNGETLGTAKPTNNPKSTMQKLAQLIKEDLAGRISSWSDDEYAQKKLAACTSPLFLKRLESTSSDLFLKRFLESNVNGNKVELEVTLDSVDENLNPLTNEPMPLKYRAVGSVQIPDSIPTFVGPSLSITKPYSIFIYSNNEALVSAKLGASYTARGTVKVEKIGGQFWAYTINEE